MIDVIELIKDFIRTKNLQTWINNRYKDNSTIIINKNNFNAVRSNEGALFELTPTYLDHTNDVPKDYIFDDILPDDYVIDLGAHIGGFSMRAALISKYVTAVEPILTDQLIKNKFLNAFYHLQIIDGAIGKDTVEWFGITKKTTAYTFTDIKNIAGGCDFLKCDCEGGEWYINPDELFGIRRIEMELHKFGRQNFENEFENLMTFFDVFYDYIFTPHRKNDWTYGVIHANMK